MGEFQHGGFPFTAVTNEGQGEAAFGIILAPQQAHAENLGVEPQGSFKIAHAQHGVEQSHQWSTQGDGE